MGKRKGCFECSRRRIICDMAEPHCHKCTKKGIVCSGMGIRYRFSPGIASRGEFKNRRNPVLDADEDVCSKDTKAVTPRESNVSFEERTAVHDAPHCLLAVQRMEYSSNPSQTTSQSMVQDETAIYLLRIIPEIQLLDGRTQLLFSHFATVVAPALVPLESHFNGYRDILLPLAHRDPEIKRAVCMVAALHLGAKVPELRDSANAARLAIIFSLRRIIHQNNWNEVLSVSNWAVLTLLLAGELIRGGPDFSYLLKMLMSLVRARGVHGEETEAHSFLIQQTKMVELFGGPFLGESEGIQALSTGIDVYRDIIPHTSCNNAGSPRKLTVPVLIAAVSHATNIYLRRALEPSPFTSPSSERAFPRPVVPTASMPSSLQYLKNLVSEIRADMPGAHTLVWVYFIGAAESKTPEDRNFFAQKLEGLYEAIGFKNIVIGLETLKKWWAGCEEQGKGLKHRKWTERLAQVESLVM